MTSINATQFLQTSRSFPKEITQLTREVDRAYIDIARNVNGRTIGTYAVSSSSSSGNSYFLTSSPIQSQRKMYTFTTTAALAHGLPSGFRIVNAYGTYNDSTNQYGLIYAGSVALAGQISFYVGPANITFATGGGAPTLSRGIVFLEWIVG